MLNSESIVAIIPARGGSKGVPGKNIRLAAGRSLISWTIEAANKSNFIDRVILSSDDERIIACAKSLGCEVPFIRPENLSSDEASSVDMLIHAVETLSEEYDWVVLLQPTSPLRTCIDIDECLRRCVEGRYDSVASVVQVDKSPYWMYTISNDGENILIPLMDGEPPSRRQSAPDVYVLNGAVYVIKTSVLLKQRKIITENSSSYIMDYYNSIDIDTEEDFVNFEMIVGEKNDKQKKYPGNVRFAERDKVL